MIFQAESEWGVGCDAELDPVNRQNFEKLLKELPKFERFRVNWYYIPDDFGLVILAQLHHFGAAPEEAYGTV